MEKTTGSFEKTLMMEALQLKPVTSKGQGIHSGLRGSVSFFGRQSGTLKVIFKQLNNFEIPSDGILNIKSNNGTELAGENGHSFYTPEHLLATCLPFWNQPVTVVVSGQEAPAHDGSGIELLTSLGQTLENIRGHEPPSFNTYPCRLHKKYSTANSEITVEPAEEFSVRYRFNRAGIGEVFTFNTQAPGAVQVFLEEIVTARTFIFWQDYLNCRQNNLLKGASFDTGILVAESRQEFHQVNKANFLPNIDEYPYLNRIGFRGENEFARHKILDLTGDLALIDLSLPRLKIEVTNGGHFQNHLLVKDLINERKNK